MPHGEEMADLPIATRADDRDDRLKCDASRFDGPIDQTILVGRPNEGYAVEAASDINQCPARPGETGPASRTDRPPQTRVCYAGLSPISSRPSATNAGRSPSLISMVEEIASCVPCPRRVAEVIVWTRRTRLPTGTGAVKRTRS